MKDLTVHEVEAVSGGVVPVLAIWAAGAFVAGVSAGIAAAAAAKSDP